jgi:hypothetical protein
MPEQNLRFASRLGMPGQSNRGLIEQAVDGQVHACAAKVSSAIAASNSV